MDKQIVAIKKKSTIDAQNDMDEHNYLIIILSERNQTPSPQKSTYYMIPYTHIYIILENAK